MHDHKTDEKGPAKLVLDVELMLQARAYEKNVRPLLTVERGDIPQFFVLPGSRPIVKLSNVRRVLSKVLGYKLPDVRKMGATAVARLPCRTGWPG